MKRFNLILSLILVIGIVIFLIINREQSAPADLSAINNQQSASQIELGSQLAQTEVQTPTTSEQLNNDNKQIMETQLPSGLKIAILQEGQGSQVTKAGQNISVHYTGTLVDGTKFDSSVDRGQPFNFVLGAGMVIRGWDEGLVGMKIGEKRKLTIPSNLAYGDAGTGPIPPQATLVFEVELLAIQ